jgi:trk system potassium uptake protein
MSSFVARSLFVVRLSIRRRPAISALVAYSLYALLGAILLALPLSWETREGVKVGFVDALFISTSAVSTTGLVTLDPGTTFNFLGEIIILLLMQIGGIGYMTAMSFAYLTVREQLSPMQSRLTRAGFGVSEKLDAARFTRRVIALTLIVEAVGAGLLSMLFYAEGAENAVWQGVFHAISSFCTAGFSLFPTSFEAYRHSWPLLMTISILSYLGAIGFLVLAEILDLLSGKPRRLSLTTKLVLTVTFGLFAAATVFLWIFEPSIRALPVEQQFSNAVFQAMTASTTVGFNSVPIGALSPAVIMVLYLLMFVGASPAGTGGGLKSTTAGVLWAVAVAAIRDREKAGFFGALIPRERVQQSAATLVIALLVIFAAVTLLDLTGEYAFDKALFEVISALATVGLSMGLTAELNDTGKLIVTAVMLIGRVGILAFFTVWSLSLVSAREGKAPEKDVIL